MHPINHAVRELVKAGHLSSDSGFVYFISDGEAIKIGFSEKPKVRLSGLQSGHSRELTLLGTVPASIHSEHDVHQRFAHIRLRREWFEDCAELRVFIDQCKHLKAFQELPTAASVAAAWLKWVNTQGFRGPVQAWGAEVSYWLNMLKSGETPEKLKQLQISMVNFDHFRRNTPSVIGPARNGKER